MVSTFTPNIQLEEPARGDQVGVWDTPVNNNMTAVDLMIGGVSGITLNNAPVVLSAAQFQSKTLVFSSTLTGNVTITFPSSFQKSYEIRNVCTGSSAFVVTLQTTVAGAQAICAPPGETVDIFVYAGSLFYKNLGPIGSFMDYGGSSVPAWISGCTVAPYLNCDGSAFSSATYPALAVFLGGTTLPDARGRVRAVLNQTTGRLTSSGGNLDGNTNLLGGGSESVTLASSQLPASIPYNDQGHQHGNLFRLYQNANVTGAGPARGENDNQNFTFTSCSATIGITINPSTGAAGTGGSHYNVQPTYIGGLTLIRSGG